VLLLVAAIGAGAAFLVHTAPFAFVLEALRREASIRHMPADPLAPAVYLTYDGARRLRLDRLPCGSHAASVEQ